MPGQTIGTVNVQVGSINPKVPTINYGGSRTLKGATDLSLANVQDNYVIAYQASTQTFVMKQSGDTITNIDEGFF